MAKKKPHGYWKIEENAIAEARKIMQEHGFETFPSHLKLVGLGYSNVANAIQRFHGGYRVFRKSLGESMKIRLSGQWKDLDYVVKQAQTLIEEYGYETLPSCNKLRKIRYSSLSYAIIRYHGGFNKFRKLLGENNIVERMGKWKSLDFIIQRAQEIIAKYGFETLPSQRELYKLGHSNIAAAIIRHHGGFRGFRKVLGEPQRKKDKNIWKSLDYTIQQAKEVMEEHDLDILPPQKKLYELGYSTLAFVIINYHGGFHNFRKQLGEELTRTEHGRWRNLDYTIHHAQIVLEEHGYKTLPSQKKLYELGHSGLSNAISKHHGGFPAFRAMLEGKQPPTEKENLTDLVKKYAE